MPEKKSFVLYQDIEEVVSELSREQAGDLFMAILSYNRTGEAPKLEGALSLAFIPIRQAMDRDGMKYQARCQKNKENISKRWGNKQDTNVYDCKNRNTKHTDNDNDNDNDKHIPPISPKGESVVIESQSSESLADEKAAGADISKPASPSKTLIDERFLKFWEAYPKKKSKGDAEKAWKAIKPNEALFQRIMRTLDTAKESKEWARDSGQYIPYPATWLRAKGWEDEFKEGVGNEKPKSKRNPDGFSSYTKKRGPRDIYDV